jgi:hypothetical protein
MRCESCNMEMQRKKYAIRCISCGIKLCNNCNIANLCIDCFVRRAKFSFIDSVPGVIPSLKGGFHEKN